VSQPVLTRVLFEDFGAHPLVSSQEAQLQRVTSHLREYFLEECNLSGYYVSLLHVRHSVAQRDYSVHTHSVVLLEVQQGLFDHLLELDFALLSPSCLLVLILDNIV